MCIFLIAVQINNTLAEKPEFLGKIHYDYFEGEWESTPDFGILTPIKSGQLDNFDLSIAKRDTNFAIRFTGTIDVPVKGKYLVSVKANDVCRMYVGNELVVQIDGFRGRRPKQIDNVIEIDAGEHSVIMTYLQRKRRKVLAVNVTGPQFYKVDKRQWLYIGWENDHPKTLTFMGGSFNPGRSSNIQFTVDVNNKSYYPDEFADDRRDQIGWHLADEYLPSPVSTWRAGNINVQIQHFANRILDDKATAVYSRVSLSNSWNRKIDATLNLNTGPDRVICLTADANASNDYSSKYRVEIPANKSVTIDFITLANGTASPEELKKIGSFDSNYNAVMDYYKSRINKLTHPVILPNSKLVSLFKSAQIVMWESIVKVENGDLEMRGSGGNDVGYYQYDRTFSHDVPNMVAQFIREGEFEVARGIMESSYYQKLGQKLEQDYLDAIPKYIIPYALYLQFSGDTDYFTADVLKNIQATAHLIHSHRDFDDVPGHKGIMQKSNTLDNRSDYLIVDNFAALHGLAAYKYICDYFQDTNESLWAANEMKDLNQSFNQALDYTMARREVDWYMAAIDDDSYFWRRGYDGNWIGTSMMMSTFPWNASLKGFDLGGTWKDAFDRSIDNAIHLRNISNYNIPQGSWGAWWGSEYGSVYNTAQGLQTLFSDKHRTLVIKNLEFLSNNETAPFQWGESFVQGKNKRDWTRPSADYETWGLSYNKQGLLESCISVNTNGNLIIGRGIPMHWSKPGDVIQWKNVRINNNKKIDFTIEFEDKLVTLKMSGDQPEGGVNFNLPIFVNNVGKVTVDGKATGSQDYSSGEIVINKPFRNITVTLKKDN